MSSKSSPDQAALRRMILDLERALSLDADALDRTGITTWLMHFSAQKPFKLHHPRIGDIHYGGGLSFEGSPALIFDQFVLLSVEDLVERHVHAMEAAMVGIPSPDLLNAADQAAAWIASTKARLLGRAAEVKGKLLRKGLSEPRPVAVAGVVPTIPVEARLQARAAELSRQRTLEAGPSPLFVRLERFAKANPALLGVVGFVISNVVSFVAGLSIALVAK